jgi:arylsulfotransferase ASST
MNHFVGRCSLQLLGILLLISICPVFLNAQQTVGLFQHNTSSSDGYTLIRTQLTPSVFLIDEFGREVHSWTDSSYSFLAYPYLQPNGDLIRKVANGGGITAHLAKYDWDGNKIWDWSTTDTTFSQHHDFQPLPNGNVLMNVRQNLSVDDFIAAGGDTTKFTGTILMTEKIIEVMPTGSTTGNIVWVWSVMDHLIQDYDPTKPNYGVVEDHPELLDLNFGVKNDNWLHANGVNYNAEFDQIIISFRLMNEFWVIDHSTTTAEASGHTGGAQDMGGDILYRWGNPLSYRAGDSSNQQLSEQHNAHWIPEGYPGEGNIIVFNNGNDWDYTSIVELETPVDMSGNYPQPSAGIAYGPVAPTWTFIADPPESFLAPVKSGCQRLDNGNTLMVNGPDGLIREVNSNGDIIWLYQNPIGRFGPTIQEEDPIATLMFLVHRYPLDHPAFYGRTLLPGATLEIYPITISGTAVVPSNPIETDSQIVILSTIKSDSGLATATVMIDTGDGYVAYQMFDDGLHMDGAADDSLFGVLLGLLTSGDVKYYIEATDNSSNFVNDPYNSPSIAYNFTVDSGCCQLRGDVAIPKDGMVLVNDIVMLVDYLFKGGTAPICLDEGDCAISLDGNILVNDIVWVVNFLFKGGAAPPAC